MGAVGRHSVAEQLGVDPGPSGQGDLLGLDDQDARPFGEDEAVAVAVERPAGVGRVVVPGREGSHGGEPAEAHPGDRGLGCRRDHDVGVAEGDVLEGVADGVVRAEAQAVATAELIPFRPYLIDTWPEPALTISLGIVNGLIRDGPLVSIVSCWVSNSLSPPIPSRSGRRSWPGH